MGLKQMEPERAAGARLLQELYGAEGRTVLVTGGATGIGRMIAAAFVAAGARVLIASRKGADCERCAAELNADLEKPLAEGFAGDLSSEEGVDALIAEVSRRTPHLDVLVNNAGVSWAAEYGDFPYGAWSRVMDLNVTGLFMLTQGLTGLLAAAGRPGSPARIINIGSVMGTAALSENSYSYAASKAAVHHLTRILAKELSDRQITVNAIAPGLFPSRMTAFATAEADTRDAVGTSIPLRRLGEARDMAGTVLFLAGPAGAYLTGAILPLDGGISVATGPDIFAEARP